MKSASASMNVTPVICVNGFPIYPKTPKEALAMLLETTPDLKYWSYPGLREMYIGCIKTVAEWSSVMAGLTNGSSRAKFTRFVNKCGEIIHYTPKSENRMTEAVYESILVGYGLGMILRERVR